MVSSHLGVLWKIQNTFFWILNHHHFPVLPIAYATNEFYKLWERDCNISDQPSLCFQQHLLLLRLQKDSVGQG